MKTYNVTSKDLSVESIDGATVTSVAKIMLNEVASGKLLRDFITVATKTEHQSVLNEIFNLAGNKHTQQAVEAVNAYWVKVTEMRSNLAKKGIKLAGDTDTSTMVLPNKWSQYEKAPIIEFKLRKTALNATTTETPKTETPKTETPKTETPKTETPKTETPAATPTPETTPLSDVDELVAMAEVLSDNELVELIAKLQNVRTKREMTKEA